MQNFNWVDYVFLAIFFFSILAGLSRGLVKEVISLLTIITAFVLATLFANPLAIKFTTAGPVQEAVNSTGSAAAATTVSYAAIGLSFAVVFAGIVILGSLIGAIINLAFSTGMLGIGNRILGGVFGLFKGFIINLVIIFVVQLTGFSTYQAWQQSQLVVQFQPAVLWLANLVSPTLSNLKNKIGTTVQDAAQTLQQKTQ